MRRLVLALAILAYPCTLWAQLDASKPEPDAVPVSAYIRSNWLGLQRALNGPNYLRDSGMQIWAAGDSAAPSFYALSGAGAAIARTGTGLADTTNFNLSSFAAKVTSGGAATAYLSQDVLSSTSFRTYYRGTRWSIGAALKCATASSARFCLYDGVASICTAYATSTMTWVSAQGALDASATQITARLEVAGGTIAAYIVEPTVVIGGAEPVYPIPSRPSEAVIATTAIGALTTGTYTNGVRFDAPWPAIAIQTRLRVGTAPTTQAVIVDCNKNGSTMYSTRPQVAATAYSGNAVPDTTYSARCFAVGDYLSWDVDQVGSGTAGSDLTIETRLITFQSPIKPLFAATEY